MVLNSRGKKPICLGWIYKSFSMKHEPITYKVEASGKIQLTQLFLLEWFINFNCGKVYLRFKFNFQSLLDFYILSTIFSFI